MCTGLWYHSLRRSSDRSRSLHLDHRSRLVMVPREMEKPGLGVKVVNVWSKGLDLPPSCQSRRKDRGGIVPPFLRSSRHLDRRLRGVSPRELSSAQAILHA